MESLAWVQVAVFAVILLCLVKPLGVYMARVFSGQKTFFDYVAGPVERGFYRLAGIDAQREQNWQQYTLSLVLFNVVGVVIVMACLMLQHYLPFNPQHMKGVSSDLAFNTASSFASNTNWQAYAGESTLSYFSQMTALAVQNFLSAATGIAVAIALIRGFARRSAQTIGNFWVDMARSVLWILLPISIVLAVVYMAQGVPDTLAHYVHLTTISGAHQTLPLGPVASQEAIKSLGTNGGGFFNANSAHPFENPTGLTNFLQVLSIFAIGAALTYTFGRMVKNQKQGWILLGTMGILFFIGLGFMGWAEMHVNPHLIHHVVGGNMEGKEVRFGIPGSVLYDEVSTAASDGGVNSVIDSYTPIGGMVALVNMALGEVIIGGVGTGLYTMLVFIILTVFIAGLMIGRSPEFLGKKIEAREMKLAVITLLISPLCVLVFTAIACLLPSALHQLTNHGPHGFTELLYAYTSAAANNGSAFAGLNANTPFFNWTIGITMLIGRFGMIIPILAIAGGLATKKTVAVSEGTFPTTGIIFLVLLIAMIVMVVGLTFFPALSLGPIHEQLAMVHGQTF